MKNNFLKWNGFTLVELIVVITIVAVLATIAFISFQSYSEKSRDTVRMSDLKNIEKWLSVFEVRNNKYPEPDNKVDITASWVIINYQWFAWNSVLWIIWVNGGWIDPIEWDYYTYVTNSTKTKYQLLWYLESEPVTLHSIKSTYAWLENRYPQLHWSQLGVLINPISKEPIQKTGSWVDIFNNSNSYDVYINKQDYGLNINWAVLLQKFNFRLYENWSCDAILKNNKSTWDWLYIINPDWNSEYQVYCDMTTYYKGLTIFLTDTWNNFKIRNQWLPLCFSNILEKSCYTNKISWVSTIYRINSIWDVADLYTGNWNWESHNFEFQQIWNSSSNVHYCSWNNNSNCLFWIQWPGSCIGQSMKNACLTN
jgi:prepilin-type N-terminal cleavage/methylation domain-containing protein